MLANETLTEDSISLALRSSEAVTLIYVLIFGSVPDGLTTTEPNSVKNLITSDLGKP